MLLQLYLQKSYLNSQISLIAPSNPTSWSRDETSTHFSIYYYFFLILIFFTFFQVFLKWSTVGWKTGCFCQTFHRNISTKSNLWAVLMPAITVVLPKIVLELSFQKRLSSLWHVSYFQKTWRNTLNLELYCVIWRKKSLLKSLCKDPRGYRWYAQK